MRTNLQLLVLCIFMQASPLFSQIYINEILADNESGITDAQGDNEDWVEIYNAGQSPVDLAGYYISDDPAEPTLWQIPATNSSATTVPAGGYLILWADKDTDDGENHIDLKLGAGGETLTLTAPDGSTQIDQIIFGAQNTDTSYGRVSDADPNFQFFPSPSPGASNGGSSSIVTYETQLQRIVQQVSDDAIEYGVSSGGMDIDHWAMTMTESWSNQKIGVRFQNITIPQGATILEAYLQFTTKDPSKSTGYSSLDVFAEMDEDAAPFQEVNKNISDRELTNSSVNWEPEEWLIKDFSGPEQITPNLKDIVQQVVDQSNWEVGNAMAFVITGTGQRSAHNFTSNAPPTLVIKAEVAAPTTLVENVYINEVASNGTDFADDSGGYEDWIELYNANNFPVSLGGLYLSDKLNNLTKWQIASPAVVPANGYLLIYADEKPQNGGLHAEFKVSSNGEDLSLVQSLNNELIVIDQAEISAVPFKGSTGRSQDAASDWVIFGEPTPFAANTSGLPWIEAPTISLNNGVFSAAQSITITHPDAGISIYYTTDSSLPDDNATEYNGPITVDETQGIRAIAYKSGHAPSQVSTKNYLFDPSATLPVLMITTDPDNLFDDETGIYTVGTNGILVGNCDNNFPANFWHDWERPANLTLFETNGDEAFSVNAGIKISGNCSRRYALKSLNIYLRGNQYGDGDIDYKLFPNRDFKKYKRIRLRSSGQDYRSTMLRDGTNQRMLAEVTDVEYQNYRPTLVYINGEYWGIQNFRDLYGGEYFDAHFDVKEEDLDLVKSPKLSNDIKEGDDVHYQQLYSFVDNNSLSDNANYEYFKTQFDIESFMDYWISMVYMASSDWPANNVQVWRPRTSDGKWRYMYLDTDATTNLYSFNSTNGYLWDTFAEVLDPNQQGWPFDSRSTLFFRELLGNDIFKNEFIQRTCSYMELVLNKERANEFIDVAAQEIDAEIGRHKERWAFDNEYSKDYEDWLGSIAKFRQFFDNRAPYYYDQMEDHFSLTDQFELTINYDANTNGNVFLHWKNMPVPYDYTGTYYTEIPIRVIAEADEGYTFSHWLETGETNAEIDFAAFSNSTLTPIFEALGGACIPDSPDFQDADGDGVCDLEDECPGFDDTVDTNNNGIPDGCEQNCDDDDNDGVCNVDDQCPGFDDNEDENNNGIPDGCESCDDDDNDGVCNVDDQCPGFDDNEDTNNNGIPDGCEPICTDDDDDGVCQEDDCDDNDPTLPATVGSSCDDGNSETINDVYLADGCTCQGTTPPIGEYCESEGEMPWHEWIQGVSLNTINNTSGKSNYSDFTSVSTMLVPGSTYDLSLTTGYSWATYDEHWAVWIDFNENQTFEASEKIFSGILNRPPNGTDDATLNTQVTIPGFAATGNSTRMRVSMSREAEPMPCDVFTFGEVEDYAIILGSNGPCDDADNDGVCDQDDQCPGFDDNVDTNNNGIPDGCDCADDDNDGVCNDVDLCPGFDDNEDNNNNGIPDGCEPNCTDDDDDGICLEDDCDDNDPNLPAPAGSACDDGNANTINDAYLADGCTCEGTTPSTGEYCQSEGDFPWHDWIQNVSLNTINNASGKSNYSDFTSISTFLEPGGSYDLSLVTGYSWFTFDEHWAIWIDFNENQTFEASEKIFSGILNRPPNGTDDATLTAQVTLPNFVATGNSTRMRVSMGRDAEPLPCEVFPFGEVEDYTIILGNNVISSRIAPQSDELKIYPVPTRRIVNIDFPNTVKVSKIRIVDAQGQVVWVKSNSDLWEDKFSLDVAHWREGMYFIQAELEEGKWRYGKMIVTRNY